MVPEGETDCIDKSKKKNNFKIKILMGGEPYCKFDRSYHFLNKDLFL